MGVQYSKSNNSEDAWETKTQIVSQASSLFYISLVGHEETMPTEDCANRNSETLNHRCNGSDEGDEDDDADEGDDETGDGQTARSSKHTDKGEDDAEQPENPVEDWNPAEDEADEGENETGGANTI